MATGRKQKKSVSPRGRKKRSRLSKGTSSGALKGNFTRLTRMKAAITKPTLMSDAVRFQAVSSKARQGPTDKAKRPNQAMW